MTEKHFILATAGHVDHGKSALVKALTGTDPDRLPEEKARKITIELGFAELTLDPPNEQRVHVGIIDVPGHEDFVRSMITGVGSVDLALLVVAADDGWMPQTEEHIQILIYLGVKRAVVAVTKSDLAKIDNAEIREQLQETPFADSPIIPTSAPRGDGIDNLKRTLAAEFAKLPPTRDIGKPRLFIDRAFALRGMGTVVTGTLTGGKFSRGQTVSVQPRNLTTRIRSIQSHGRDLISAQPATRTALNLTDVEVGNRENGVRRGDVVTIEGLGKPSETLEVLVERLFRSKRKANVTRPIKTRSSVYLHHGTSRVSAKITFSHIDVLTNGQRALAQLRLSSPILAFVGDRFILRDSSEQFTIAGGSVLDLGGSEYKTPSKTAHSELLSARVAGPNDVALALRSLLARHGFAHRKTLLHQSNFSDDEIGAGIGQLKDQGVIVVCDDIVADAAEWQILCRRASALIDTFHKQHPEKRGLDLADLRAELNEQSMMLFDALVSDLCRNGFVREKSIIARQSHRTTLPAEMQDAVEKILVLLAAKPFDPPGRRDIARDQKHQHALQFLIEQGKIIQIGTDIVLTREALEQMERAVVTFISENGPASASELRQHLGSSRRVIIPFLEHLDRAGITQRLGDSRRLRNPKPATVARP